VAQKGAGGNPGAITTKGGDGARGSIGTGRGGGSGTGKRATAKKKTPDKSDGKGGGPELPLKNDLPPPGKATG
jgi:hypothetical protein